MTRDEYVATVAYGLHDLPWRQKRELLADLREHLAELPPDADLVAQLGQPLDYAAELRQAAGLERRRGPIAFLRARRPRNVFLTVLTLVVLGLAIGTLAWIHAYQPLRPGNVSNALGAHESITGDGIYYIFRQGKSFQYGTSIENDGPYTVRIVGVPLQYGWPVKFHVFLTARPTRVNYGGDPRPLIPFRPFDLKPGYERMIFFRGRYATPCASRGVGLSEGRDSIPVRFKFLWTTKTVDVPFNEPMTFVFTKASLCTKAKP